MGTFIDFLLSLLVQRPIKVIRSVCTSNSTSHPGTSGGSSWQERIKALINSYSSLYMYQYKVKGKIDERANKRIRKSKKEERTKRKKEKENNQKTENTHTVGRTANLSDITVQVMLQ